MLNKEFKDEVRTIISDEYLNKGWVINVSTGDAPVMWDKVFELEYKTFGEVEDNSDLRNELDDFYSDVIEVYAERNAQALETDDE